MKTPIERMQMLQQKIDQLKIEQSKIEQVLVNHWIEVLKITNAFKFDFDVLVGGLLEMMASLKSNPELKEVWRNSGKKFCQARLKLKGKCSKTELPLGKNLDSA